MTKTRYARQNFKRRTMKKGTNYKRKTKSNRRNKKRRTMKKKGGSNTKPANVARNNYINRLGNIEGRSLAPLKALDIGVVPTKLTDSRAEAVARRRREWWDRVLRRGSGGRKNV